MLIDANKTKAILDYFKIPLKGVLHVGAHKCEEKGVYNSWGISDDKIVWVDANQDLVVENACRGIPNCYHAVLDETEKDTKFKITNNGESSSLLDFGSHKESYPHIVVVKEVDVKTQTLSNFIKNNKINIQEHNIWNFDIQGSEYSVFKGSKEMLKYVDCIYAEVNTADVYQGCGKLNEMDELLNEYGLTRVETHMTGANWGDAIYVRTSPYVGKNSMTIGIPTYKRYSPFLENYIPKYLQMDNIDEILICDETGEDIELIKQQPWGNNPKLRLIKNEERLGAYHNKLNLLKQVNTAWVALIDSDNEVVPDYFNALYKYWNQNGINEKCVYIPADVESRNINESHTNKPITHLGGIVVSKENWNWFLHAPVSGYALNLGNCVFHKSQIEHIPSDVARDVMVDCQVVNKALVEKGFNLVLVPGMKYYHIVHPGSLYLNNIDAMQRYHQTTKWEI